MDMTPDINRERLILEVIKQSHHLPVKVYVWVVGSHFVPIDYLHVRTRM